MTKETNCCYDIMTHPLPASLQQLLAVARTAFVNTESFPKSTNPGCHAVFPYKFLKIKT